MEQNRPMWRMGDRESNSLYDLLKEDPDLKKLLLERERKNNPPPLQA